MGLIGMTDILEQQAALQAEANAILEKLALDSALRVAGRPVRVGSSALGLMVRRDIDITVVCENLADDVRAVIAQLVGKLTLHPKIGAVRFRDDSGSWNRTPEDYPDGLYVGITFRAEDNNDWNLDIWFVDEPDRQPDLMHVRTILPRLSTAAREAILAIKTALAANAPGYPKPVASFLVYEAVLDGGVSNFAEFENWLGRR